MEEEEAGENGTKEWRRKGGEEEERMGKRNSLEQRVGSEE